jgi:hypothetical protein
MAPTTRSNIRNTPPPSIKVTGFYKTPKRVAFLNALERGHNLKSIRQICREVDIDEHIGRRWKAQRETLGSKAIRTTRQYSTKLGRPSKVTKAVCKKLVDPAQNPLRDQLYEAQIEYHHLHIGKHQLQRKLKEHTKGGQRYKYAFIKKQISRKNRLARETYEYRHCYKPIEDFYSYIIFTDEAHIDPGSQAVGDIL